MLRIVGLYVLRVKIVNEEFLEYRSPLYVNLCGVGKYDGNGNVLDYHLTGLYLSPSSSFDVFPIQIID